MGISEGTDRKDIYEWADRSFNSCPTYGTGFTQLFSASPYCLPEDLLRLYPARLPIIRSFQTTALGVFRAALRGEVHPDILHWLINETPESMGISYHRSLEERHFTLPVFFRTDEVKPGRIVEINCPAALWGELQLTFEFAAQQGYCSGQASPADQYAGQLIDFLQAPPVVHQFLDKASSPAASRFFIERTRPRVKYWSIDRGIRAADCNFIRHQTLIGLWTDDFLHDRLSRAGRGLVFDAPPHVLFDQKATLVLPYWSRTRQYFSDEIRDLFPFTTPLLPEGIELPDGACISIDEFCRWPRSHRAYYLKLAGFNPQLNWGSKAVYRLSNLSAAACRDLLRQCLEGFERGRIWLLQKEETQDDEVEYLARDGTIHQQTMRAMFGGFYGPGGCLGVIAQHGEHYKVHSRQGGIISYVLAGGRRP